MDRLILIFSSMIGISALQSCSSVVETTGTKVQAAPAVQGRISLQFGEKEAIGKKIWQNECGGTVSGLTSWNQGEDFPSLGIGHFIWYVAGRPGPFEESFPSLIRYLKAQRADVPVWLEATQGSPWTSRNQFLAEQNSARMKELREFLARTVDQQTGFIVLRLENSLPLMKNATSLPADRQRLEENFYRVARTPAGVYALIDYVNFKGEGIKPTETYRGEGWGLRQVLLDMRPGAEPAHHEFSEAAKRVLARRVANSDPARQENRWLKGWTSRCEGYKRGI